MYFYFRPILSDEQNIKRHYGQSGDAGAFSQALWSFLHSRDRRGVFFSFSLAPTWTTPPPPQAPCRPPRLLRLDPPKLFCSWIAQLFRPGTGRPKGPDSLAWAATTLPPPVPKCGAWFGTDCRLVSDVEQIYVVQYQQIFLHPCCFHLNQIEPLELVHLFCCCMVVRDHIVTYNASVAHWQSFQAATDTVVAFAHHLKNGHLAVGFRLTVHRQKYESITLHPNLFPEMKGVNLLLKTHRNNDKSNLKLKTVLQELLHVDIFSWQTKPSFFSSHTIQLVCL